MRFKTFETHPANKHRCATVLSAIIFLLYVLVPGWNKAFAQRFDDVIANVLNQAGCGPLVNPVPAGNLGSLCGAGIPQPSGGSTTALTNDAFPALERRVEKLMGPWNLYFTGDYESFRKQLTTFEPGYTNNIWRIAIGADYGLSKTLTLGGALRYSREDGDFRGGGNFSSNSYGFIGYGTFIPAENAFVNLNAGYLRMNYNIARAISVITLAFPQFLGNARGKPDGNEFQVGANGGYDFRVQNFSFGPRFALDFKTKQINAYSEDGGTGVELKYSDQHEYSLTTSLGVQGSVAISTAIGVFVPQLTMAYFHEFLDPQRKIAFKFVEDLNATPFKFENDRPDRNYFNIGGGIVLQLARGIAPFINYRALVAYRDQSRHRVTAGVRVEF